MRPETNSILRILPAVLLTLGALLLLPPPADASPGYASFSIGFGHSYRGPYFYGHYRPWIYHRPYPYWRYERVAYPVDYREIGAVQLKVSPKKTDVYVDGRYAGRSGKFDGFPDYLWLERGDHTLVFFREGFRTLRERIRVRSGMITEVRLEMEPGESTPPSELYGERERPPGAAEARPESRVEPGVESAPETGPLPRQEEPPSRIVDLREEGGRVRLGIEPADATVYLDGRFLGTGSDLERLHSGLLVDAGQHTLDVLHPRYEAERVSFRVEPGEDLEVRVALDASRPQED